MFALFAAPFVWISLEYIKSNFFFLAYPWGLLAHTQYQNLRIIQIASITGTYGVSFLIVMVNSTLAALIYPTFRSLKGARPLQSKLHLKYERITLIMASLAVASTTGSFLYGHFTVSKPIAGEGIKVSVVQGNIEQSKKWDPRHANFIMQTYAELTEEASKDRPALIIWPEAATPRAINLDRRLYSQVRTIAERARTPLLVGSSSHPKFKGRQRRDHMRGFRNSAFLIYPDGRTGNQRYDKILLLPFGEYVPMKGTIPWSYIKIPNPGRYVPGNEFTVFEGPTFRFGVTICWENIFPDLVRAFVRGGAQFIVNITNEAWFNRTAAPYQFVSMSVFRAVENRVFVVRGANTGVSCFIDPHGRIVDRVKDEKGQDLFIRGVLTREVIPMESKTIYTRYGDLLAWLSLLCSAVFLLIALLRKNPDQASK